MIASADDTLTVIIVMNAAGYVSPPLPQNSGRRWSRDELSKLNSDCGTDYLAGELTSVGLQLLRVRPIGAAVVAGIFSRGIEGDLYDTLHTRVDVLSRQGAVLNVPATATLCQCRGYAYEAQPFPVWVARGEVGSRTGWWRRLEASSRASLANDGVVGLGGPSAANALKDDRPRRGVSRSTARSSRQTWLGAWFSSWQC